MTREHNRFKAIFVLAVCIFALEATPASTGPCAEACGERSVPPEAVNIYSETTSDHMAPATLDALPRVYVPNHGSDSVSVIDSQTLKEVGRFRVGRHPQHIVPSWDLKTLWVANDAGLTNKGSLTPIDPKTGTLYLPTARFGPLNKLGWPEALPGTVQLLVMRPN